MHAPSSLLPAAAPWRRLPFTAHREASWSRDGYNHDWRELAPHEELTLARIRGCGCITRLWFALDNGRAVSRETRLGVADPLFLRKTVLQIFWDDARHPSVDVPVGDFFGMGSGEVRSFSSALIETSVNPGAGRGSLTSWIRMPFFEGARLVLRNDSDRMVRAFWHIDYQRWESLPADSYHFHASWRCEMPCTATPLGAGGTRPQQPPCRRLLVDRVLVPERAGRSARVAGSGRPAAAGGAPPPRKRKRVSRSAARDAGGAQGGAPLGERLRARGGGVPVPRARAGRR